MRLINVLLLVGLTLAVYASVALRQAFTSKALVSPSQPPYFVSKLEIQRRRENPLHLPILTYHYVEIVTDLRDTTRQNLSITPQTFEEQMRTLYNAGFTPVHLEGVTNYYKGKGQLPEKPIVLTFDDGYRDFYTDVFPILKKYNLKATIYIVSGFIDTTKNYLTTKQLKELARSDLIEIGSHSVNHLNLTLVDSNTLTSEIIDSKKKLEKLTGRNIKHFAYPYGGYNPSVLQVVKSLGYESAASVVYGTQQLYADLFELKRVKPGGFTGKELLVLLK